MFEISPQKREKMDIVAMTEGKNMALTMQKCIPHSHRICKEIFKCNFESLCFSFSHRDQFDWMSENS